MLKNEKPGVIQVAIRNLNGETFLFDCFKILRVFADTTGTNLVRRSSLESTIELVFEANANYADKFQSVGK